jgi:hypothetical protein
MIPNTFRTMRMRAITIREWIQLPVFGKLGLMFPPKKPSSHRITRITTIVHNMRFLLFERFAPNSSYNKHSLGASCVWGVSVSATWGRSYLTLLIASDPLNRAFPVTQHWIVPKANHFATTSNKKVSSRIKAVQSLHQDTSAGTNYLGSGWLPS